MMDSNLLVMMDKKVYEDSRKENGSEDQEQQDHADSINNTNNVNASSSNLSNSTNNVNAASSNEINATSGRLSSELLDDPEMPKLEEIEHLSKDEDVGAEADMNNMDTLTIVGPILTTRIHKDH
ncbi:hypothetical protein Tco_0239382, partial [Tanacetum coccineum]